MYNSYDKISFTSKITPVMLKDFSRITKPMGIENSAQNPWNLGCTVIGKDVYTRDVIDCTACLLTDGEKSMLMHLCCTNRKNHDFESVLNYIKSNFDLSNEKLHAIVLGSKKVPKSEELFERFVNLFQSLEIPFSIFKNGKTKTHLAYSTDKDEVFISNDVIDYTLKRGWEIEKLLKNGFEKVILQENDYI